MTLSMHHKSRTARITNPMQSKRALKQRILLPSNTHTRNLDIPLESLVNNRQPPRMHPKRRQRVNKDSTPKQRGLLRRHFRMVDHEARGQGAAVGEAQDPVEGAVDGDCLVQELVRL